MSRPVAVAAAFAQEHARPMPAHAPYLKPLQDFSEGELYLTDAGVELLGDRSTEITAAGEMMLARSEGAE